MKSTTSALLPCLIGLASVTWAAQEPEHRHGRASLEITLEGENVGIELRSPAQNVVGFEHEPFTLQERKTAESAVASLQAAHGLFAFPEGAECRIAAAMLETPDWERMRREQRENDEVAREVFQDPEIETASLGEKHVDYRARYRFECKHPDQLEWVEVQLLDRLRGPVHLDARVVSGGGAAATHAVTKDSTRVPLK